MKKLFIFLTLFFLSLCMDCYALDSNIVIDSIKEKDKLTVNFSVGSKVAYGFSTKLDYDKENMTLDSCEGQNGFEVSYNNNYIVVESLTGKSNTAIATCSFSLKEDKTSEVVIGDLTSSDYKSAVDEGDYKLNLTEGVEEVVLENIPDTAANMIVIYTFFGFIFIIVGLFLIYTFMFNKKMASVICFIFALIIPFYVNAKISTTTIANSDLSDIRSSLLGEKAIDNSYDIDSDGAVTINDLIVVKIDLNVLDVKFEKESGVQVSSNVYQSLKMKITVTSKNPFKEALYCVNQSGSCYPNTSFLDSNLLKTKLSVSIPVPESKTTSGTRLCLKVTSYGGKTRQMCKSYIVDSKPPSMSWKNLNTQINYPGITSNGSSLARSIAANNINASFGVSGKKDLSCSISNCSIVTAVANVYKNCLLKCVAKGGNSLSNTLTANIQEIDNQNPTISYIASKVDFNNSTLPNDYDLKRNIKYSFGIKGGNVSCSKSTISTPGSGSTVIKIYSVNCHAIGNNGKQNGTSYSIYEYDNVTPQIRPLSSAVNIQYGQSYSLATNISASFGLKGGNISCSESGSTLNNNYSSSVYTSSTVTCTAIGNNGKTARATYTLNRLDNQTPIISKKQSSVVFNNNSSAGYDIKQNVTASYGPKGGNISCSKSSAYVDSNNTSTLQKYYVVTCYAVGKNGKTSGSVSYTLEEHDVTEPVITINSPTITLTSDYLSYNLKTPVSVVFGSKGGSLNCNISGSPSFNTTYGIPTYVSVTVSCLAAGNNGKRTTKNYQIIEMDYVHPVITFKNSTASYSAELLNDYKKNIESVTFGKKGGSVICERDTSVASPYRVKCTAAGNNGYISTKYFDIK